MAILYLNNAFEADVPPISKFVLLALSNYATEDGVAYPSMTTLMRKTSLSKSSIVRALKYLEEDGYIQKIDNSNAPKKRLKKENQNCYLLIIKDSTSSKNSNRCLSDTGVTETRNRCLTDTVTSVSQTLPPAPPINKNHQIEPSEEPSVKEKEKKEKFDFEPSDQFLESPELELTCPSPSPAEEEPPNTDKVVQIIERLNLKTGKRYRSDSGFKKLINARFKEGYTLEQFFDVIDKKVEEWTGTKFAMYLRPSTLFGSKFGEYLEQSWPDKYRRFVNTGQISEVGAHNARVIEERRNARRKAQQRQQ